MRDCALDCLDRRLNLDEVIAHLFRTAPIVLLGQRLRDLAALSELPVSRPLQLVNMRVVISHLFDAPRCACLRGRHARIRKTVVLVFVQPGGAGWRRLRRGGQAQLAKPKPGAGTLTRRHTVNLIGTTAQKSSRLAKNKPNRLASRPEGDQGGENPR